MEKKLLIRSCKRKTVEMLKRRKLWFLLSVLFLLLEFGAIGLALVSVFVERGLGISNAHGQFGFALSLLVVLFLFVPLWRGLHMLFLHSLLFGREEMSLLFYCYSHKLRYIFAIRRGIRQILAALLCVVAILIVGGFGLQGAKQLLYIGQDIASLGVLSLAVLLLYFVLFVYSSFRSTEFLWDAVFLSAPLLSYAQTRAISSKRIRTEKEILRRFRRSFYPFWIFSALFLGLPLAFVLPYYVGFKAHLAVALIQD